MAVDSSNANEVDLSESISRLRFGSELSSGFDCIYTGRISHEDQNWRKYRRKFPMAVNSFEFSGNL